jgi:hypothetical protein
LHGDLEGQFSTLDLAKPDGFDLYEQRPAPVPFSSDLERTNEIRCDLSGHSNPFFL